MLNSGDATARLSKRASEPEALMLAVKSMNDLPRRWNRAPTGEDARTGSKPTGPGEMS
jgi:hypothetical protein